jgi:hypothetical protein
MRRYLLGILIFLFFSNFSIGVDKIDLSGNQNKREKVNSVLNLFGRDGDFILGSEISKVIKNPSGDKGVIQYFLNNNIEMITYYEGKFWFKTTNGESQWLTLYPTLKGVKVKFPILIKNDASIEISRTEKETTFIIHGIKLFGFDLEKIVVADHLMTVYKYGTIIYQRS